jgi:hypothetical protein
MKPSRHLALSTGVGGVVWAASGEPLAIPIAIAAGVLIDVDHAPDLWSSLVLRRSPTVIYPLHAWEWVAMLIAYGAWVGYPWWLAALIAAFGLHVATDQIFNRAGPWTYFFFYRARHGFRVAKVAPHWRVENTMQALQQEMPLAAWFLRWSERRWARKAKEQ